jgi:hypothetical protein
LIKNEDTKVVYLIDYPMNDRDAKRFGLAELHAAGLSIEVWDLSQFYFPMASEREIVRPDHVNLTIISEIEQFRELCSTLKSNDVVIAIGCLSVGQIWKGRDLLRLISTTPAWWTSISSGTLPTLETENTFGFSFGLRAKKVVSFFAHPVKFSAVLVRFGPYWLRFIQKIQSGMRIRLTIRPLDHVWAGTVVAGKASLLFHEGVSVTYIHTLDYDLVLALEDGGEELSPSLVFIDSMGPLHPDYLVHGNPSSITMCAHSEIVCRGLDHIEKQFKNRIVIAAHPRATPGLMEPWYGGRTLIYNQTAKMIANANVVIVAEGSTAIGLAATFRKPLVLLTSRGLDKGNQRLQRAFSSSLLVPLIDLDEPDLPPIHLGVNKEAYDSYVGSFVKRPGTPKEPFWTVVATAINSRADSQTMERVDKH